MESRSYQPSKSDKLPTDNSVNTSKNKKESASAEKKVKLSSTADTKDITPSEVAYQPLTGAEIQQRTYIEYLSMEKSYWYRISQLAIQKPIAIIILVVLLAVTIPVGIQVFKLENNQDFSQAVPKQSDSSKAYDALLDSAVPSGTDTPFYIIIDDHQNTPIWNQAYFDATYKLHNIILDRFNDSLDPQWVTSVSALYHNNRLVRVLPEDAQIIVTHPNKFPANITIGKEYLYLWNTLVGRNNNSAFIQILTPFDAEQKIGNTFIENLRDLLDESKRNGNVNSSYSYYLTGIAVNGYDAMNTSYDYLPIIVGITFGLIFILVGIVFRSAFIPVRYAVGLVIPLAFVFGLSVMVYQQGVFDFLNWSTLNSNIGPMFWMNPVLLFSISAGLALDYDIFLMSRVYEFRCAGFTTNAAIMKGVYETGSIISCAGVVMCLAFGGLMGSTVPCMQQIGFILTFSVFFDTFVTRTVMLPAFMALVGDIHWWPNKNIPQVGLQDEFCKLVGPQPYSGRARA